MSTAASETDQLADSPTGLDATPTQLTAQTSSNAEPLDEVRDILESFSLYRSADGVPYAREKASQELREREGDTDSSASEAGIPIRTNQFREALFGIYFEKYGALPKPAFIEAVAKVAAWEARLHVEPVDNHDDLLLHLILQRLEGSSPVRVLTTDLLGQLYQYRSQAFLWADRSLPLNAKSLGKRLKALKPALLDAGYEHVKDHSSTGTMNIFTRIDEPQGDAGDADDLSAEEIVALLGQPNTHLS